MEYGKKIEYLIINILLLLGNGLSFLSVVPSYAASEGMARLNDKWIRAQEVKGGIQMTLFIQSARVCRYQLQILSRNYKSYTIPICMLIFMLNAIAPLRDFLAYVNEDATPFLFPFLFNHVFLCALMFAAATLFYLDAPFYNKEQLFVIIRCGSKKCIFGQILYVFAVSALYMFFLVILSIIILMPRIVKKYIDEIKKSS